MIRRKTPPGAVLKAVVHAQGDHPVGAVESPAIERKRQIGRHAQIFAPLLAENFTIAVSHGRLLLLQRVFG